MRLICSPQLHRLESSLSSSSLRETFTYFPIQNLPNFGKSLNFSPGINLFNQVILIIKCALQHLKFLNLLVKFILLRNYCEKLDELFSESATSLDSETCLIVRLLSKRHNSC